MKKGKAKNKFFTSLTSQKNLFYLEIESRKEVLYIPNLRTQLVSLS